jgi:hypothetical protein
MSEYKYARTNSKGDVILRRDTEEDVDFVIAYLKGKDIPFEYIDSASLFFIENRAGVKYAYYYTTGRWAIKSRNRKEHYRSNGIDDFVSRFLNKFADEQIAQHKIWAEEKQKKKEEYFKKKMEKLNVAKQTN